MHVPGKPTGKQKTVPVTDESAVKRTGNGKRQDLYVNSKVDEVSIEFNVRARRLNRILKIS